MSATVDTFTDREALVWLAFRRDAALSLRVRLPRDRDEARRILEAVGCRNRFNPAEAWRIVDGWWEWTASVELALEGSPALYLRLNADNPLPRLVPQRCLELEDAGANEIDYKQQTRTVRAWWD